jgi:hypothetical protein
MMTYKITNTDNPYWAAFKNFQNLQDAETYTNNLGNTFSVELASPEYQIPQPTPEEKLKNDIDFGSQLINEFLLDNRLITPSVTEQESVLLLNQFNSIERLAKLGDIKSTKILLEQTQTDVRIFTQERKDKYLTQINNYLTI